MRTRIDIRLPRGRGAGPTAYYTLYACTLLIVLQPPLQQSQAKPPLATYLGTLHILLSTVSCNNNIFFANGTFLWTGQYS